MSGLLDAFWGYERALMADDLAALDRFFADDPSTLRGDPGGLLRGPEEIAAFRAVRGGAPTRTIVSVEVREAGPETALVVAVTAPGGGGRGLQTQLWDRSSGRWTIRAAHVSPAPRAFDAAVWRVVGDPLVPGGEGPLAGETLAVKDLFAVAGHPVGGGVPALLAEAPLPSQHSVAVARLVDAGAAVRGLARTDQLAYSLAGDNPHYGTPVNPVVAGGLPGGSSSGSAVAVSLGEASLGLATDTAGSTRVPASYQGLWGLRTTHGSVPTDGLLALAPDFDTVGLLARSGEVLQRGAAALVPACSRAVGPGLLVAPATTAVADPSVVEALAAWTGVRATREVVLPDVAQVAEAFRVHQARQAWATHGAWIRAHPDALLGAVRSRFATAATVTQDEDDAAVAALEGFAAEVDGALGEAVLVLPSAASAAPRVWDDAERVDARRTATMRLTCLAGLTGRPAVSVPLLAVGGDPVGVCLVGPRGSDLALVELALVELARALA